MKPFARADATAVSARARRVGKTGRQMVRLLSLMIPLLSIGFAQADDSEAVENGRNIVTANCSVCHAVTLTGESTHPDAPPFRTLSARYPVEYLAEALAEGISTGHPDMPEFVATPAQIGAIIAYIRSLDGP